MLFLNPNPRPTTVMYQGLQPIIFPSNSLPSLVPVGGLLTIDLPEEIGLPLVKLGQLAIAPIPAPAPVKESPLRPLVDAMVAGLQAAGQDAIKAAGSGGSNPPPEGSPTDSTSSPVVVAESAPAATIPVVPSPVSVSVTDPLESVPEFPRKRGRPAVTPTT